MRLSHGVTLAALNRATLASALPIGYSTRRSCDGAMRGADGKTTSAPLTVW